MFVFLFSLTGCLQNLDTSSLHDLEPFIVGEEMEIVDPNRYKQPLIVDWNTIKDTWLGSVDELPSKEENLQAYDILYTIYIEEFQPRSEQYRATDAVLTLEVEYLFGLVLRSMNKKHKLSRKSRKKQLSKLQLKIEVLLELE